MWKDKEIEEYIKKYSSPTVKGCWKWERATCSGGYGHFGNWKNTGITRAHRLAFLGYYGYLTKGLVLDHFKCSNRICCNPKHLKECSHKENILRGAGCSAKAAKKTHCPNGHKLDVKYSYMRNGVKKQNGRRCRRCHAKQSKEYYYRKIGRV